MLRTLGLCPRCWPWMSFNGHHHFRQLCNNFIIPVIKINVPSIKITNFEGGDQMEGLNQPDAKAACQQRGAQLVEVCYGDGDGDDDGE